MKPSYPIKIKFLEDGNEWVLADETELAQNLEWFDSNDEDENVEVSDRNGQSVELVVEAHDVRVCRFKKND